MIKTLLKIAAIAATTLALTGCWTQTFTVHPTNTPNLKQDKMQNFFVYGIGQEKTLNASKACGGSSRVAKVQVQRTFVDGLLGGLTFGIYSPATARVFCK